MSMEVVLVAPDGRSWHRSGRAGVYEGFKAVDESGWSLARATTFRRFVCDGPGRHCVVAEATLADIVTSHSSLVAMAVVFAALLASWFAGRSNAFIRRYWSLEARFRRHLNADSVVCVYQPIMHLQTGAITGCEVLARWRDIDDTIVLPDKFLAIVERHNLTRQFTRLVAERAFRELSAHLPPDTCLQVNFNIFPRDLDCAVLRDVFGVFDTARDRFQLVLEIVESDALAVDLAQREIDALRRIGIKICIDDFGTGFSNIHNLAALTVDCVKLDRAFAMAPDNSVMALMLGHAIDMIHTSGRTMVVEGVETAERLALLRESTHQVDYVQGYFVSRPLGIERYAEFLALHAARRTQDKQAA
jgi:sensor c-di-GMP phosphodiesterase-like protein